MSNLKRIIAYLLISVLILVITLGIVIPLTSVNSFSEEKSSDGAKVVRVGYFSLDGYFEGGENEPKGGAGYEYLQKIAGITGWKYEYVYGEFSDILEKMKNGQVDIIGDMSYTDERAEYMNYSTLTVGTEEYWLYCRNDSKNVKPSDITSLNGATIGIVAQGYHTMLLKQWLKNNKIAAELVVYDGPETLAEAFERKEIDAANMATEQISANWVPIANIGSSDIYFGVNPNRPDLLAELNEALSYIQINNPMYSQELKSKYFNQPESIKTALSKAEKEWIENHRSLKIGCIKDGMPLCAPYGHGRSDGLIRNFAESLRNNLDIGNMEMGIKFYDDYPALRKAFEANEIDVAFPVFSDYNTAEVMGDIISDELVRTSGALLYLGEYSDEITRIIGVERDTPMQYFVTAKYPDVTILQYDNYEACLKALKRGEVNSIAVIGYVANSLIRDDASLKEYDFPEAIGISFALHRNDTAALMLINRAESFMTDEEKNMLLNKYSSEMVTYTTYGFMRDHIGLVIVIFGVLIAALITALCMWTWAYRAGEKLKDNEKKLARALEDAKDASAAKSSFLSNMSHDLRTPMNAILGFTGMAQKHRDDSAKVDDCLNKISMSGEHMIMLINDILDMSRIEGGKVEIICEPTDIVDQMEKLCLVFEANARDKNIDFDFRVGTVTERNVLADVLHVNQIMLNILSNAVKYTKKGGRVEFTFCQTESDNRDAGKYRMVVTDTGVGMSEEFMEHIYDTFARERNTTLCGVEGTGLGMAIVKRLVDLMGGTIDIKSKVDVGTTVTVELPFEICDETEYTIPEMKTNGSVDNPDDLKLKDLRLLIVEDNEMNREIARDMLEDEGIYVEEADDGDVAVRMVEEMLNGIPEKYYDAILMDIQMPRMNGYAATREIRQLLADADVRIPIIALSANAFEEDKKKSLDAGMDAHLAKPIKPDALFATLKSLFSE